MIVTAVTNEVFPDASADSLPKIFKRAADAGINHFELRLVESRRFPAYDAESWERLKSLGKDYGITYTAASPGLFKAGLDSDLMVLHTKYLLPMSLELAETVGVNTMIVFAPTRSAVAQDGEFDRVVDILGAAVDIAAERGFTVQLENLPGSWADTSDDCLNLLEAVNREAFGYVWDTGNLYEAEQAHFRAGYDKLKPYIRNVHLKDGAIENGEMIWKRYGEGVTDVKGQVEALKADGYTGTLVLEAATKPHHIDDFPTSVNQLKTWL
ncbi:Sugar phosphate isomerase/epimerase [Devosia crocina]|uniref:Sugar phosphate isomerase/epimerase n=1 Tax=Devosia crocina TaxID=429728 RepID=A0A1I7MZF9_9HYPH|nr:sugar phosphate isomerase/epimerase family protein [Devosia crocina]SFV27817.1 Sugar phosphate isomerase/epimerase [Devosia crocina]